MGNNKNNKTNLVSLGLCDVLFLIFLVLKLTKLIDWSWWWVTAPLWLPLGLLFIATFILLLITKND